MGAEVPQVDTGDSRGRGEQPLPPGCSAFVDRAHVTPPITWTHRLCSVWSLVSHSLRAQHPTFTTGSPSAGPAFGRRRSSCLQFCVRVCVRVRARACVCVFVYLHRGHSTLSVRCAGNRATEGGCISVSLSLSLSFCCITLWVDRIRALNRTKFPCLLLWSLFRMTVKCSGPFLSLYTYD